MSATAVLESETGDLKYWIAFCRIYASLAGNDSCCVFLFTETAIRSRCRGEGNSALFILMFLSPTTVVEEMICELSMDTVTRCCLLYCLLH